MKLRINITLLFFNVDANIIVIFIVMMLGVNTPFNFNLNHTAIVF